MRVVVWPIYLRIQQHIQDMVWIGLCSPLQSFRQELVLVERASPQSLTADREHKTYTQMVDR